LINPLLAAGESNKRVSRAKKIVGKGELRDGTHADRVFLRGDFPWVQGLFSARRRDHFIRELDATSVHLQHAKTNAACSSSHHNMRHRARGPERARTHKHMHACMHMCARTHA